MEKHWVSWLENSSSEEGKLLEFGGTGVPVREVKEKERRKTKTRKKEER